MPTPTVRNFDRCPRCRAATAKAIAFSGAESEFWYECTKCNTFINTYLPQPQQASVHTDYHKFIGNFGGYGSGKTLTSREEVLKHILITPGGNTLIGANVASQYEQTIKRDIEGDIPAAFVSYYSTQKQYMDIINGHRVMYRPFDDPEKLRSYNISMFVMVEASEIKDAAFVQLQSRLRNMAASIPETDKHGNVVYEVLDNGVTKPKIKIEWTKGIIESNPDSGWIRSDVLLNSDKIYNHGEKLEKYYVPEEFKNPAISTHTTSSDQNKYLPPDFIENLTKNKPAWWVAKYVLGSFSFAQGLVYPSAMQHICNTFEIPRNWKRIVAYDYGLADDSCFLFGAIDETNNLVYIYKEVVINNRNIEDLSKLYFENTVDIPSGGMIGAPIIDPKSGSQRDYDKKTLIDHFLDYGISFKPGHISLDARVYRLNTYLECGKIKIMSCCKYLIEELRGYKFKARNSELAGFDNKPEDKNNHAINPLEWIVMELPANPNNLLYGVYNKQGIDVSVDRRREDEYAFSKHVFSDEEEDDLWN